MSEYAQLYIDSYAAGNSKNGLYAWVVIKSDIYDEGDFSEDPPKRVEIVKLVREDLYDSLRSALERIVHLKDNQSISYEKWELMVDVAVKALQRAGGGE